MIRKSSDKMKSMPVSPIYLVSGRAGSGKTTLVRKLAESIGFGRCVGFFTCEIRERKSRTGFQWQTFDGRSGILADLQSGPPRVGKYHVVLDSFERMLETLQEISSEKVLLIDEVGKMECLSEGFRNLLQNLEKAPTFRLFTVPVWGTPFIESFKARHSSNIVEIGLTNREEIRRSLQLSCRSYTENVSREAD
jgi:nucleoside-triphosphatase